jgi:hypothetical protein
VDKNNAATSHAGDVAKKTGRQLAYNKKAPVKGLVYYI